MAIRARGGSVPAGGAATCAPAGDAITHAIAHARQR